MEPASGLSTYCRKCGSYYKLGQPVSAARGGRLTGLMNLGRKPAGPAQPQPAVQPRPTAMPLQIQGFGEQDAPMIARAASFSPARSVGNAGKEPPRVVQCIECNAIHRVAPSSTSTICQSCSTYIDLRDIQIKDRTNQRIRTRGNVTVEKKGALLGTSIHCGNLTVYGTVAGSIYASGDVVLRTDGRIIGEIRCRRFVLEKKCDVQCLQPVQAEVMEIHGHITGHFRATRLITLSRHASLTGSATAQTLSVEPGAMLNGQVLVHPPEPDRRSSGPLLETGLIPLPG